MATTPVPVSRRAAGPASTPDIWRSLRAEMDQLFDRFMGGFGMMALPSARLEASFGIPSPAVDITDDAEAFRLTAELPGMTEKDVQVSVSGDTLTIRGEKRQGREEKEKNYFLTERSYGEFQRSFLLPDGVDREKITAEFASGVLTVKLPKSVKTPPKKIEVRAAA